METVYDWLTMAIFAGLIVLFLQRSALDDPPDTIWHYLVPSVSCAAANYFGNEQNHVMAIALLVLIAVYVVVVLNVPGNLKK